LRGCLGCRQDFLTIFGRFGREDILGGLDVGRRFQATRGRIVGRKRCLGDWRNVALHQKFVPLSQDPGTVERIGLIFYRRRKKRNEPRGLIDLKACNAFPIVDPRGSFYAENAFPPLGVAKIQFENAVLLKDELKLQRCNYL